MFTCWEVYQVFHSNNAVTSIPHSLCNMLYFVPLSSQSIQDVSDVHGTAHGAAYLDVHGTVHGAAHLALHGTAHGAAYLALLL